MISKNQIKLIQSLKQKKMRITHQMFFAEGAKVITELLNSNIELIYLYSTQNDFVEVSTDKKELVNEQELKKISALTTPNNCLGLFKIPSEQKLLEKGLIIALDSIRDPGNLGTIIRLCDWFGINQIICSKETVDVYNPKVVQATMGSLSRVSIHYLDLESFISKTTLQVYGTFMEGNNIYQTNLSSEGIIVFGNEGNGICPRITQLVTHKISIPRFGSIQKTESLNVASATAIILSEFCRG